MLRSKIGFRRQPPAARKLPNVGASPPITARTPPLARTKRPLGHDGVVGGVFFEPATHAPTAGNRTQRVQHHLGGLCLRQPWSNGRHQPWLRRRPTDIRVGSPRPGMLPCLALPHNNTRSSSSGSSPRKRTILFRRAIRPGQTENRRFPPTSLSNAATLPLKRSRYLRCGPIFGRGHLEGNPPSVILPTR